MPVLSRQPQGRRMRRAETETRVLEVTRSLLKEGASLAELRIDEIASAAGISRTAFYDYFENKRDLLLRLIDRTMAPLLERVDELAGGQPSGPEGVRASLDAGFALVRANAPVVRAAAEASAYDEVVSATWRSIEDRFVDAIAARIERQQAAGAALPGAPRAQAVVLASMVTATWLAQLGGETGLSDDEMLAALHLVWRRAVYGDEPGPGD